MKKYKKLFYILAVITVLALIFIFYKPPYEKTYLVTKVIDGDTIVISTGEHIRYLGIDSPETHHPKKGKEPFGEEATKLNKNFVDNKYVKLEYDKELKDIYGRTLAFVYVKNDKNWEMVSLLMVKNGLAKSLFIPPNFKHRDEIEKAQMYAIENKLGIWAKYDFK